MKSFTQFFKSNYMVYENIISFQKNFLNKIYLENRYIQEDNDYDDQLTDQQKQQNKLQQFLTKADRAKIQQQFSNSNPNDPNNVKLNLRLVQLVKKFQEDKSSYEGQKAAEEIIKIFTKYIHYAVWKAQSRGVVPQNQHDDLFQAGIWGLMLGLEKINVDENSKNARTYNVKWSDTPIITVPVLPYIKHYIDRNITNPFNPQRHQSISSDNFGVANRIREISLDDKGNKQLPKFVKHKLSLVNVDDRAGGDNGQWADKEATVGDIIPDTKISDNPLEDQQKKELHEKFMEYLKRLPSKEMTALKLLMIDAKPYEEIGNILHMSKQAAKYFCDQALAKVRQFAKEEGFQPDQTIKTRYLKGVLNN